MLEGAAEGQKLLSLAWDDPSHLPGHLKGGRGWGAVSMGVAHGKKSRGLA